MSYANWNPTAFYLINDRVDEGTDGYIALSDNYNTLPSTHPAVWSLLSPSGTGLTNVVSTDGSGITSIVAGSTATLSSSLVAGLGINLTPSVIVGNKSLTISTDVPLEQTIQFQQPTGVNGGASLGAGWNARPFNVGIPALLPSGQSTTIPNLTLDTAGPSLYGGYLNFILDVGTYGFSASLGNLQITSQCRLYDITNSTEVVLGTSVGNDTRNAFSTVSGLLNVSVPTTYQFQTIGFLNVGSAQEFGQATGFGTYEVYATVTFYQYI